jgi:hypothetical protein
MVTPTRMQSRVWGRKANRNKRKLGIGGDGYETHPSLQHSWQAMSQKNIGTSLPSPPTELSISAAGTPKTARAGDTAPHSHGFWQRRDQVLKVIHDLVSESGSPLVLGFETSCGTEQPAFLARALGVIATTNPGWPTLPVYPWEP